jgi:hypothetical protein
MGSRFSLPRAKWVRDWIERILDFRTFLRRSGVPSARDMDLARLCMKRPG